MQIHDKIYGTITVETPVIQDLINSKPMQRLKHIDQHGAHQYISPNKCISRFDHSVGAWYLSAKFNRPIAEQIASLLHDIPHTAFSHVIDIVMNDPKHEYHDRFFEKIIRQSEIPEILAKHHLSLDAVLDKKAYPLLNNDLPDISVDRWDYFMRDGYVYEMFPIETVQLFLSAMFEKDEKFYFNDIRIANQFAVLFMNCSRLLWLDPVSHGSFFILATVIKTSLEKGYITDMDCFTTDDELMQKIRDAKDGELNKQLDRLTPGLHFEYTTKEDAEFSGMNKPRYVDPWVMKDGKLVHLSSINRVLKQYFEAYKKDFRQLHVKEVH